jgi:hypothetical protein
VFGSDFWIILGSVGTLILVVFELYKFRQKRIKLKLLTKLEPPKPVAKPEILDAKNCFIGPFVDRPHPKAPGPIHPTKKEVWFEFKANNTEGTIDCSLSEVSIELLFKKGKCVVNAEKHPFSTSLPKHILKGQIERIVVYGICEPALQPQEDSVEGIITAKFNNGQSKNTKGIFIMKDWLIDRNIFTP